VSGQNVELHRRAIEAFNARDIEALIAICDPSVDGTRPSQQLAVPSTTATMRCGGTFETSGTHGDENFVSNPRPTSTSASRHSRSVLR
jgi:hypothetical protein